MAAASGYSTVGFRPETVFSTGRKNGHQRPESSRRLRDVVVTKRRLTVKKRLWSVPSESRVYQSFCKVPLTYRLTWSKVK